MAKLAKITNITSKIVQNFCLIYSFYLVLYFLAELVIMPRFCLFRLLYDTSVFAGTGIEIEKNRHLGGTIAGLSGRSTGVVGQKYREC